MFGFTGDFCDNSEMKELKEVFFYFLRLILHFI